MEKKCRLSEKEMRSCFGGRKLIPCVIIVIITVPVLYYGSRNNCEIIILIVL